MDQGYPPYGASPPQNPNYQQLPPPGAPYPNFPPSTNYGPPAGGYVPPGQHNYAPLGAPPPSSPGFGGYPQPQGGYQPPPQGGYQPPPQGGYQPQSQGGYQPGGYPPPSAFPQGGYVPPGYQPPIVNQPGQGPPPAIMAPGGWMNIPQGLSNCPPGLEYLSTIDQLLVHQKVELLEVITGFETNNKFTIKNSVGQKVYYAVEDNDCCTRNCCGPMRPFEMKILDNFQNQVINIQRPLACESCCFPCCLQSMEISSPPGNVIGTVEQEWSIFKPSFSVKNERGEVVLKIEGPVCRFSMCGDIEFQVLSSDGETQVGKITKQWSGLLREMFTDSDYFGITFPMDLDVRMKAVLLGACFLIDIMFFEKSANQESDRPGMIF